MKLKMIVEMIDNGFLDIFYFADGWIKKKFDKGEISYSRVRESAIHNLQYHVLKKQIEEKYENYLTWKKMRGII